MSLKTSNNSSSYKHSVCVNIYSEKNKYIFKYFNRSAMHNTHN